MDRRYLIGILVGAFLGLAFGGYIYKSKSKQSIEDQKRVIDADLIAYQNLAPTPKPTTPEPTSTPTIPKGWCICPTATATEQPISAKKLAAIKAWKELEAKEIKLHANDFIQMPVPKTVYKGVPVEFFAWGPSKWISWDSMRGEGDEDLPRKKVISPYEKFYGVSEENDKTIINGFSRRQVFDDAENFDVLHKPFYGIKVIYFSYGDSPTYGSRPSPRWIYIVWSVTHKAPVPFPYASKAVELVKRQTQR